MIQLWKENFEFANTTSRINSTHLMDSNNLHN